MTREEARTTLKEMHDSFDEIHENTNYEIGYEQMTALDMAIEALSTDAISREEHEEVKAYMDTLVDAFIEDGEELAESVKGVRCKDCKWHKLTDNNDTEICTNKQWDISMAIYPIISADDFCSYGERREE